MECQLKSVVILLLFVLLVSAGEGTRNNQTLKLGFLHHNVLPTRGAAIEMAIEDFQARGGLPGYTFE